MKKILLIAASAAGIMLTSCSKESITIPDTDGEIILGIDGEGLDLKVDTRATAVTSIPATLYWSGTTGNWKSETPKWDSASASVTSGSLPTGKYQTATPTSYNYYVSTNPITFGAGGSTISADNSTDVIAGCTQGATTLTSPSITMEHVFARTGSLSHTPADGYSASNVSWKIQSKTGGTGGRAGTYNIATKAWGNVSALSQQDLGSTSDLYCVPGEYTITVTYTLSKGDYQETNTVSGNVTLVAGKVNNISTVLPIKQGGAHEIVIGVTLSGWGSNPLTLTL